MLLIKKECNVAVQSSKHEEINFYVYPAYHWSNVVKNILLMVEGLEKIYKVLDNHIRGELSIKGGFNLSAHSDLI